ncbi:DUF3558 family protein [Saccharomonospora xinjiangensis]|uniref:DUF3558 family protein n=1 Tax=Saccharomonospora xinjiangensis TaxID=75294 RepID=UPI003510AFB9
MRVKILAAGSLFLLAISGCSNPEQGVAESNIQSSSTPVDSGPETSSSSVSSPPPTSSSVSSSIDPCSLLAAEDLAEVGKFDPEYKEGGGARSCYWQSGFEDGGDGFAFAVSVRDAQAIDTLKDNGGGVHPEKVNQRPAAATKDPKFGDCTFAMKIDASSRVDITVAGEDGSDAACEAARAIANMVEPRLPNLQ